MRQGRSGEAVRLVALLCLVYMVSQFYRSANAVIGPDLMQELSLTADELGVLTGVFFIVFALCQLPAGMLLDRFGPRLTMIGTMLFAVAGALVFANAEGLFGLSIGRALLGIGSCCLLIGPLVVFSRWFPAERFATMSAVLIGTGSCGNLLATAPLAAAAATIGWRGAFVGMAAVTAGFLVLVFWLVRDAPAGHAYHSRAPEGVRAAMSGLGEVLRNRNMPFIFAMNCTAYATVITVLGLWGGPYLHDVYGLDTIERGNILLLMAGAAAGSYFLFGPLDRVFNTRKGIVLVGGSGTVVALLVLALTPNLALWQTASLLVFIGGIGGYMVMIITHGRSIFPEHLVGRGLTTMNMGTMGGAAVLQMVTGYVVAGLSPPGGPAPAIAYQAMFAVLACALGAALLIYSRVEDVKPGVAPKPEIVQ